MVFIDFEQQFLIRAQIDPPQQRVQELVPIRSEYVIRLMVSLPQRIAPLVARSLQ